MFSFFKSKTEGGKEESRKSTKPKGHVFVCTTDREEGTHPCSSCAVRGGIDILDEFIFEIKDIQGKWMENNNKILILENENLDFSQFKDEDKNYNKCYIEMLNFAVKNKIQKVHEKFYFRFK